MRRFGFVYLLIVSCRPLLWRPQTNLFDKENHNNNKKKSPKEHASAIYERERQIDPAWLEISWSPCLPVCLLLY